MKFCERDFYEKYVHFFHEGKYYRLSSSCYRQLEIENENGDKFELDQTTKPTPEGAVRADSIISVSVVERAQDGKIHVTYLTQCDMFFEYAIPRAVVDPFLVKATKQWYQNLDKHYTKNHKRL